RRCFELAVQYLPDEMLHAHVQDLAAGRAPVNSRVYNDWLKRGYPDISAISFLWPAMNAKLANFPRMGYPLARVRLPEWVERYLPPWVPVLVQKIPLLGFALTPISKR